MTSTVRDRLPGALSLTAEQRRRFDEDGFFLVEQALTPTEVARLTDAVDIQDQRARHRRGLPGDAPLRVNNIVARDPAFRELLDHPVTLPLVVDVLGIRIQLRASNLDVRPPLTEPGDDPAAADFARHWHRDEPAGGWPTVDGVVPFLELKVGYYLTDLTAPGAGALRVIPGSHRRPDPPGGTGGVTPVELAVPAGTAVVFRTSLLHDVAANRSAVTRKCLYLAYQHRWLRPSDYVTAPDDLLAACTPIQRQLLGGVADPANLVWDPDVEPCSTYWTPGRADLPLQEWAERGDRPADLAAHHDLTVDRADG